MESGISAQKLATGRSAPRVQSFEDLECYQRAMAMIRPIHDLVKSFPDFERYDLGQQMRRASKSIPTNIAEGFARQISPRDYRLFLNNAVGSTNEMLVHLDIAKRLDYVSAEMAAEYRSEYSIIARQLNRLIRSWK